jgi:hypothetical protein
MPECLSMPCRGRISLLSERLPDIGRGADGEAQESYGIASAASSASVVRGRNLRTHAPRDARLRDAIPKLEPGCIRICYAPFPALRTLGMADDNAPRLTTSL